MELNVAFRRRLFPAYRGVIRRLHDLRFLFVELTHKCNLTCLHCGSDCVKDSDVTDLEPAVILKTLEEIRRRYDPHKITVVLSGGEPLCYANVFDLGRRITDLEFPWGMVTNGLAWTAKKFEEAKGAGLTTISISLDGLAPEHNWLRGHPKSFDKAIETIRWFLGDRFWQEMDVITCVNQRNLASLDACYELLSSLNVPGWRLFTISPIGRAGKVPELFLSANQYKELLGKIRGFRSRGELPVQLSESGYLGRSCELVARSEYFFCRAGVNVGGIMVNGDILACPNIDRRFRQGNVLGGDSFVKIWEDGFREFRNRAWMRKGTCASCDQWSMCEGNSFHLWDLDAGRTRLCHFREYGLDDPDARDSLDVSPPCR